MPCIAIHLAVAKKYLEKHPDENYNEFILGTIAPDITLDDVNNIYPDLEPIPDILDIQHPGDETVVLSPDEEYPGMSKNLVSGSTWTGGDKYAYAVYSKLH